MQRICPSCEKPLKDKAVVRKGKQATVQVCKSPICRNFGKEV